MSYNSGVDSLEALLEIGLITLQSTPEPKSILELRSSGIKGTRLLNSPSIIEDNIIEYTRIIKEVY